VGGKNTCGSEEDGHGSKGLLSNGGRKGEKWTLCTIKSKGIVSEGEWGGQTGQIIEAT